MSSLGNLFSNFKSVMYKKYGENPGSMLVHTGVLGWILSSLAQVSAVVFNDKISHEQKSFLIPQEFADAAVNIVSFYVITSSFKNIASKLVSTGKFSTKTIRNFLAKQGNETLEKIGKLDFNIEKLPNFSEVKSEYKPFKNGVDVVASTVGSIISCNIVTPILRNQIAAKQQKETLSKLEALKNKKQDVVLPKNDISMEKYQQLAAMKYSSGNLKI